MEGVLIEVALEVEVSKVSYRIKATGNSLSVDVTLYTVNISSYSAAKLKWREASRFCGEIFVHEPSIDRISL